LVFGINDADMLVSTGSTPWRLYRGPVTTDPRPNDSASLHGLTPEEALRALLAVKPDDPRSEDDGNGDDGGDEQARAK
jgi:hypothetical protein